LPLQPIDALIEQLKGPKPFDATSAIRLYEALKRLSDYLLKFGAIEGRQLATDAVIAAINEGNQNWSTNIVFSATDFNTVAWTAGILRFQDGSRANIVAGNTGNISALTYIYYDGSISQTALLVTSDSSKIVGDRRRLVCVAEESAAGQEAYFLPLSGKLGINEDNIGDNSISTDKIQANSIVAGKISAGAVTADKISVSTLAAIVADIGLITAGTLTGALIRTAASGARVEIDVSNGFRSIDAAGIILAQLYADGTAPKFTGPSSTGGILDIIQGGGVGTVASFGGNPASDETYLRLALPTGGTLRVSIGAADSGGTGFRLLRIPN